MSDLGITAIDIEDDRLTDSSGSGLQHRPNGLKVAPAATDGGISIGVGYGHANQYPPSFQRVLAIDANGIDLAQEGSKQKLHQLLVVGRIWLRGHSHLLLSTKLLENFCLF